VLWQGDRAAGFPFTERYLQEQWQQQGTAATLTRWQDSAYQAGFWLCEWQLQGDSLRIYTGPALEIGAIDLSSSNEQPGLELYRQKAVLLSEQALKDYSQHYLKQWENEGYPFASVRFLNYYIAGGKLYGTLQFEAGPAMRFDSLVVKGYDRLSPKLLRYDLNFKKGMRYREAYLGEIAQWARQTGYLKMNRPPAVGFFEEATTLYLYLEKEAANQVDGIAGLNTDPDGQTTVTGQFNLQLLNVFNGGEGIGIRWQRPDDQVQSLALELTLPYLFKTPFWLSQNLNLFRQDTSFVNTEYQGVAKYRLAPRQFVTGSLRSRNSNALNAENGLGNLGSVNSTLWGLGMELDYTNRKLVPTKGYALTLSGQSGERKTTDTSFSQQGWELAARWYQPFGKLHVLKTTLRSQALLGRGFFDNELFRLGGINDLRGFNEQSIFTSAYALLSAEYRLMIGEYDYLTAFADWAYTEKNGFEQRRSNRFLGLGAGLNFRTQAGLFSFFLAAGSTDGGRFDLRATKVHIGYVSIF